METCILDYGGPVQPERHQTSTAYPVAHSNTKSEYRSYRWRKFVVSFMFTVATIATFLQSCTRDPDSARGRPRPRAPKVTFKAHRHHWLDFRTSFEVSPLRGIFTPPLSQQIFLTRQNPKTFVKMNKENSQKPISSPKGAQKVKPNSQAETGKKVVKNKATSSKNSTREVNVNPSSDTPKSKQPSQPSAAPKKIKQPNIGPSSFASSVATNSATSKNSAKSRQAKITDMLRSNSSQGIVLTDEQENELLAPDSEPET
jgi:hypothetical protein